MRMAPSPHSLVLCLTKGVAVLALGLLGSALAGCSAHIGDSCTLSTDCSVNGDRLCDNTQTGGYCTEFNCEPDSCPDGEAVCVSFDDTLCGDPDDPIARLRGQRLARTFCMKPCGSVDDCRSGYECLPVGVRVIDTNPVSRSICIAATTAPPSSMEPPPGPNVCDAGPPLSVTPLDAPAPMSTESGSDGDADAEDSGEGGDSSEDTSDAPDSSGSSDADASVGDEGDAAVDTGSVDGVAAGG
jgi:hypothetical protein